MALPERGKTQDGVDWEIHQEEDESHKVAVTLTDEDGGEIEARLYYEAAYWANLGHIRVARALASLDASTLADETALEKWLGAVTDEQSNITVIQRVLDKLRHVPAAVDDLVNDLQTLVNDHNLAMANLEID